ncbi:MAG: HD domain-containing protein [Desulfurivibrio sp.]|nr:HD domain-containing protein [Desulfurivibrio sp.]
MKQASAPVPGFSYNRVIVALVVVVLASLILINYLILTQQRQYLMQEVRQLATVELAQAATFMTEPLLRYRFADIEQFIHQWGANNHQVVRFEAITPDGHQLTSFQRPITSPHRLVLEKRVAYGGRHLLTLRLEKDYSQTVTILGQLRDRLLLASLFISVALGVTLWFVFRLLAIRPLEREINQRRRAEEELAAINHTLEERVQSRTREIRGLLEQEIYLRQIMQTVSEINSLLITSPDLETLLRQACKRLVARGPYEFCWLGLLEEGALAHVYHATPDTDTIRAGEESASSDPATSLEAPPYQPADPDSPFYAHPAARCLRENRVLIETREHYPRSSPPWRQPRFIAGFWQMIALPLQSGNSESPLGVMVVYTWMEEGFAGEEVEMLKELAGDLGFAVASFRHRAEVERLTAERTANYEQTILTFVNMIDQRDTYTAGHTQRVADYSRLIARRLGLPEPEIERLARAAILHDIGKIATPDAVLLKPGQFTPLERDLIKLHTVAGHEMLAGIEMYQDIAKIVLHHHERHDGSGYPDRLAGEDIPLPARILAVADTFDAMTTNRIYQPRSDVAAALAKLQALSGTQFHPEVVVAAVAVLPEVEPPTAPAREPAAGRLCMGHEALCDITQSPIAELEKQRLAYFFSDPLTGLYNEDYLKSALQNQRYQSLHLCHLQGLAQFNKQQGWKKGNQVLRLFADELRDKFPDALLFRIYGNDFAVITQEYQPLNPEELAAFDSLTGTGISPQVRYIDLTREHGSSIDKLEEVELSSD